MTMGTVATIIIEPRLLVREALESLMENHSYHFVCGASSAADIEHSSIVAEGPKLVVLSALSADNAVAEAVSIRKLWPDSKIVLLFEHLSPADFQQLITSQLDGCVPLFVSPHTLFSMLDLVMIKDVRVMVVGDAKGPSIPSTQGEESQQMKLGKSQPNDSRHESMAAMLALQQAQLPVNGVSTLESDAGNGGTQCAPAFRNFPKLSEREAQILDGLVKGHANKVIARTWDIAEATVKVHMKSILRKIHVGNRTQAAIWALENGYPCDEVKVRALKAASAMQGHVSTVEIAADLNGHGSTETVRLS
jgi:two-component system nitrate/nitrite response regulator NarL